MFSEHYLYYKKYLSAGTELKHYFEVLLLYLFYLSISIYANKY